MGHARADRFTFAGSSRPMGAGDIIWLTALGIAARGATTAAAVQACLVDIAAGQWAPSDQLVCDCLDEMARARHLSFFSDGRHHLFHITLQGRGILAMMLSLPIDRPGAPLGQMATRVKLAFLDLAEPADQRRQLAHLIERHREELQGLPRSCTACHAPTGCFGRLWSDHRADGLRRDLDLLERMMGMIETPPPVPGDGCATRGLRLNCISS